VWEDFMVTSLPSVQIEKLPQSVDEFVALRDRVARTPQGGAAMMIVALLLYAQERDLGAPCLAAAIDPGRLEAGAGGYQGMRLHRLDHSRVEMQLDAQPYLPRSYIRGATPDNGYRLPAPPYTLDFSANPYSGDPASGTTKVFVACAGADSPRPVTVRRGAHGLWQAQEWSSLVVGIRAPVAADT
jgi:hypothetical protein